MLVRVRARIRFALRLLFGISIVSVAWIACDPGNEDGALVAKSLPGRERPLRVVSLSPLASHFAVAIGAVHPVLAVDAESSRIPEFAGLPVVDLAAAAELLPDVVLVEVSPSAGDPIARALQSAGIRVIEFAPHDLEDVIALSREVGSLLVGAVYAHRFENDLTRPLAAVGGASFGQPRPRVVAVVAFDPVELAGGHSFETDLIELAGGQSVTHGGDEARIFLDSRRWTEFAPDLILVTSRTEMTPAERASARERLPARYPVAFFAVDTELFWLREPVRTAQRLRALIEPLSRAGASTSPGG